MKASDGHEIGNAVIFGSVTNIIVEKKCLEEIVSYEVM